MQIKNLSSSHIWRFGQILSSVPETGFSVRHMALHSGDAAEEFRSDVPVILDYVSGMSLLVIYEDDAFELYYLDRLFELCPGVHFSIAALEDSCQIDCYTSESSVLLSVAEHPAVEFQSDTNSLKFNQLCTFFYQECARDFYFRGEHQHLLHIVQDAAEIRLADKQVLRCLRDRPGAFDLDDILQMLCVHSCTTF